MGSCRARSVYLTTPLLGRLCPLSGSPVLCTFFRQKLTFLNQRKGENDRRKYFMINLHKRMLPTSAGVEPAISWSPVGRASNWATEAGTHTHVLWLSSQPPAAESISPVSAHSSATDGAWKLAWTLQEVQSRTADHDLCLSCIYSQSFLLHCIFPCQEPPGTFLKRFSDDNKVIRKKQTSLVHLVNTGSFTLETSYMALLVLS